MPVSGMWSMHSSIEVVVVRPIFILSLPRSGSTLLQRLLATHPAVATSSEPWLLLPVMLGYREGHVVARYRQRYLAAAFEDFLATLPDGAASHQQAVRRFATTLYEAACGPDQTHFLDKTPRYHQIAGDLLDTFPDAHVIVLWRNPLAVAASCIETWSRGRFFVDDHRIDLIDGLSRLVRTVQDHGTRLHVVRYEALVAAPEDHLPALFAHCGLTPLPDAHQQLGRETLEGRMGDARAKASTTVVPGGDESWPATFASPVRRRWARRYLRWLGPERLATMGYDGAQLEAKLATVPTDWRSVPADLFWLGYGRFAAATQIAWRRRRRTLATGAEGARAIFE